MGSGSRRNTGRRRQAAGLLLLPLMAACTAIKAREPYPNAGASGPAAGVVAATDTGGASSAGAAGTVIVAPGPDAAGTGAGAASGQAGAAIAGGTGSAGFPPPPAAGSSGQVDAGPVEAGASDAATSNPPCSEGLVRCGAQERQRERCNAGGWIAEAPCAGDQICSADPALPGGTCQAISQLCRGKEGQRACDSAGVMYSCSNEGVATRAATCLSAQLCMAGLARGRCPICLPGTTRCTGANLERCNAEGSAHSLLESCATAALCSDGAERCAPPVCQVGQHTCVADMLRVCNPERTGYRDVLRCQPGRCDASGGECDVCAPNTRTCNGNSVVSCDAYGQRSDTGPCAGLSPFCVGDGRCVACKVDGDCAAPGQCDVRHCSAAGSCEYSRAPDGTSCTPNTVQGAGMPGVCSGLSCFACRDDADCRRLQPAKPYCHVAVSASDGQQVDGYCYRCKAATDCPSGYFCRYQDCVLDGT